jgi:hypothetical protein
MKRLFLLVCFGLLTVWKASAALNLSFGFYPYGNGPMSFTVDAGNNSLYPYYYQARPTVGAFSNTGCAGRFTPHLFRKLPGAATWTEVFGVFSPQDEADGTYNYYSLNLYQPEGTTYQYYFQMDFNPIDSCGGNLNESKSSGVWTITVRPFAHPCFTLGNSQTIFGNIPVPTDGSPTMLCNSGNLFIDGSCSENETKYFVGVEECNVNWSRTYAFEWGKWYFTSAGLIDLQTEIYNNPADVSYPGPNPPSSVMNLKGGSLTAPGFVGQYRYYRVTLATGEPSWESKVALIRVNDFCRTAAIEVVDVIDIKPGTGEALTLSPNPVKDWLDIKLNRGERLKAVTVYDFRNNLVFRQSFTDAATSQRTDLSALEKGLYIVETQTDTGTTRRKIIKE